MAKEEEEDGEKDIFLISNEAWTQFPWTWRKISKKEEKKKTSLCDRKWPAIEDFARVLIPLNRRQREGLRFPPRSLTTTPMESLKGEKSTREDDLFFFFFFILSAASKFMWYQGPLWHYLLSRAICFDLQAQSHAPIPRQHPIDDSTLPSKSDLTVGSLRLRTSTFRYSKHKQGIGSGVSGRLSRAHTSNSFQWDPKPVGSLSIG